MQDPQVIALPMGEFTFPAEEEYAGQTGVVVAYAIRHTTGTFLFDTGFGFGNQELDDYYQVRANRLPEVLARAGVAQDEITALANCHLHADHAGQNSTLPGIPIHVQPAELARARGGDYTILDWIEGPGVNYVQVEGDHDIARGVRVLSTPGHSPGHQSLVIDGADGPKILAGQAVYSVGEWTGDPTAREGRTTASDQTAYDASVERLRALDPAAVLFGHDRQAWHRVPLA